MLFRFLNKHGMVAGKHRFNLDKSLAGYRDSDLPKATGGPPKSEKKTFLVWAGNGDSRKVVKCY